MLLGAIPAWPHSRSWGYGPSSGLGLVLLIVVILMLSGRLCKLFGRREMLFGRLLRRRDWIKDCKRH
jgi:hypothetical protein